MPLQTTKSAHQRFNSSKLKPVLSELIETLSAMGGNNRHIKNSSSSSFSVFNIFKTKRPRKVEDTSDEYVKAYKVFPSDDDRDRWVAKPGIDKIATSYIDTITKEWSRVA